MQQELILVLDTNTHIHYQPFTEIDWRKTFGAKRIRLMVPLIVLDELDRIKNEHKFSHIRRRAQTIANLLDKYIDVETATVKDAVEIEFLTESAELSEGGVKPDYDDDKIINCVNSLSNQRSEKVILITHDSGLTRRARLRGLHTGKLPDDCKIEFVDESEKKYRELEQKHRRLEKVLPDLLVTFENEQSRIEREIKAPISFPSWSDFIAYNTVKQEYTNKIKFFQAEIIRHVASENQIGEKENAAGDAPKMTDETASKISLQISRLDQQLDRFNHQLRNVPASEVSRFESEANRYLEDYWHYFQQRNRRQNAWNLILEMKFVISNKGMIPAQDIELDLVLPEDTEVYFQPPGKFPIEPIQPVEPVLPRIEGELLGEAARNIWNRIFAGKDQSFNQTAQIIQSASEEKTYILRFSKNYKNLNFKFKKLKHTQSIHLPAFYIRFGSFEKARSFHFDAHLLADNTPEKSLERMHVIINKPLFTPMLSFGGNLLGL